MEYSVGSLAELISGKKSAKKLKLVKKTVEQKSEKSVKVKQKLRGEKRKLKSGNADPLEDDVEIDKSPKKKKKLNKKVEGGGVFLSSVAEETNGNEKSAKQRIKKKEKLDKTSSLAYNENTIFIGNVPIDATKSDIKKHFRKYGTIETVRIRGIPVANPQTPKRVAAIKKEFHPDRNTVHAYIRFNNSEDAKKAEVENGALFKNHHLRVHCCGSKAEHDESKAIFIGNLNFDAEEEDLWTLFKVCGPISHVRIVRDGRTGIGKGFGYVNFKDADSVQLALEMENVSLKNRVLRISLCDNNRAKKKKKHARKDKNANQKRFSVNQENKNASQSSDQNKPSKLKKKTGSPIIPKKMQKSTGGTVNFSGTKFDEHKKKKKPSSVLLEKKKLARKLTHKKEFS
ncbi:RNA-binding protein 34 [Cylas formicarius]|uniref:RNA-binding protein 34 n=1 Tax=Cylas formicarius TaxID=197179 RepID=UPI002958C27F|nr:RNA-binding protein 34 [Cylas formicarius]